MLSHARGPLAKSSRRKCVALEKGTEGSGGAADREQVEVGSQAQPSDAM